MAHKQAHRRKQKSAPRFRLPKLRMGRVLKPLVAVAAIFITYELSLAMLDRQVAELEISGPLQRVTALQIEAAIGDELDKGFLRVDLNRMQRDVVALPWIDKATVARRWPNRIAIAVSEQVPAAIWGKSGLLNVRGDLFITDARHIPAELPHLSGPDDRAADVARRYLAIRDRLIQLGLDLRSINLDPRGAWQLTLSNGVEVRLGRKDVEARSDLFLDIVANIVTSRHADMKYVDMRYSNGFTIGWKQGAGAPDADAPSEGEEMLALRGMN